MNRALRIAAITMALTAIGSMLGAAAGATALWIASLASGDPAFGVALLFAAVIGGALGAAALPLFAWLLLRHVALGLMFVLSATGTILGGVLGWLVPFGPDEIVGGLRGAVGGFVVSAVAMWLETRHRRRAVGIAART